MRRGAERCLTTYIKGDLTGHASMPLYSSVESVCYASYDLNFWTLNITMVNTIRLLQLCAAAAAAIATPAVLPPVGPFTEVLGRRQSTGSNNLTIDLGYAIYQGANNATSGINSWKGSVARSIGVAVQ